MRDPVEDPAPPDRLPDALVGRLDSLEIPELKAVRSYVEGRVESLRTPIEAEIEAKAAGEVLDIESHGEYALVWISPPESDARGTLTELASLYHVRRTRRLDGSESLRWSYLGDVRDSEPGRRESFGRPLDAAGADRPRGASDELERSERGE